ncbi:unnamed protein product [Closterium sp. NIES-54]
MTWVYVLSEKSEVAETVKTDWLPMVERQQYQLVKAIRTDRGGEFLSKEFSLCLKKNIRRHSLTMPYSPAMNGIAERANQIIKNFLVKSSDVEHVELHEVLEEIGFTPSSADHSLFMLGEGEQRSFVALGDVSFYLGLHIERDVEKRCMRVHQRKYLEALAASFGQSERHVATPFPSGFKCVKGPEEESVGEEERCRFHLLVGSLMYAAVNTRPDVAFATGQLARVVQCPNEEQVAAGMRVAKYLGQTLTVGLQYSMAAQRRQKGADGIEPERLFLTAFSDASYSSEPEDMKSVGGFICCVGGGPTSWESKKQVDQALSSVESEYMALFRAVREIVWQRSLVAELGEEQQGPTPLYNDSQGAIALAKNPVLHGLTKHKRVKWHWTRSMVAAGEAELHYVKTKRQPADMTTKRLVEQQHWKSSAVSLSSCEAELYAGTIAAQEACWLTFLLQELGYPQPTPTLWCDNKSTIYLSQDPVHHTRTKHIELRHFFIRDLDQREQLNVEYVASDYNLADLFTKPPGKVPHHRLLGAMGLTFLLLCPEFN